MPLFSIIIPVFNSETYLDKCLESIINQSYTSFEVLLIDDGSTDESFKVCCGWSEKDDRVWVYHQENMGASAARNVGLRNAHGSYIQFVDSDDTLMPDCLMIISRLIKTYNDPDFIEFRLNYYGLNETHNIQGTILQDGIYDKKYLQYVLIPALGQIEKNEGVNYNIFNVLRIVKRDLIIDNNIEFNEQIRRWEDWLFAMEVYFYANEMVVTSKALYNYFGHEFGGLGGRYNPLTYKYVITAYRSFDSKVGKIYNVFSEYAVSQKIFQIERCIREIFDNEGRNKRNELFYKIISDEYFKLLLDNSVSKEGIMFLRPFILKQDYEKALRKVITYLYKNRLQQSIRRGLSICYHKYIKGDC